MNSVLIGAAGIWYQTTLVPDMHDTRIPETGAAKMKLIYGASFCNVYRVKRLD